jgi:hypothetical protein
MEKITDEKKNQFFWIKNYNTSKHEFFNFFLLLWVIFVLLDPDPDRLTRLNPDPMGIRIRIRNPVF